MAQLVRKLGKSTSFKRTYFARWDSIYHAVVETAPAFKKIREQYYSFDGVLDVSPQFQSLSLCNEMKNYSFSDSSTISNHSKKQ
jgi:hypothetical protein